MCICICFNFHSDPEPISPEEDNTISSGSLCVSPRSADMLPLCASTPRAHEAATSCNGLDRLDNGREGDNNKNYQHNRHTDANVVSESTHSIDVLSGGESDAGDTFTRNKQNNNSISSSYQSPPRSGRRRGSDHILYSIAKELLMTERTYKRDMELVTVSWSSRVSSLAGSPPDVLEALGRPCLALEPLVLAQGALLARLERWLAIDHNLNDEKNEPEYKRIGELLYDYLSGIYDAYTSYMYRAGGLLARAESVRRTPGPARAACGTQDAIAPLTLASLILRPLHRTLYYAERVHELSQNSDCESAYALKELCSSLAEVSLGQLGHAENHATMCQLQRDIIGYDKLLVPNREFLRLGCLYKHSTKGLQQRMFFLFSDIVMIASKSGGASQFRAHSVIPLHSLHIHHSELPHSFTITYDDVSILLSASNDHEYTGWYRALEDAIDKARDTPAPAHATIDNIDLPTQQQELVCGGAALAHVCWHRTTSLSRDHLHLAMTIQLSGYLLRKFKNSHGWQKLWVVFAVFTLYFYKSWQDELPLASLPLLGYTVCPPSESDAIHKEYVFKLQFKNHIYFFRADSQYTYTRWMEVIQNVMTHSQPRQH